MSAPGLAEPGDPNLEQRDARQKAKNPGSMRPRNAGGSNHNSSGAQSQHRKKVGWPSSGEGESDSLHIFERRKANQIKQLHDPASLRKNEPMSGESGVGLTADCARTKFEAVFRSSSVLLSIPSVLLQHLCDTSTTMRRL
jgi:hypothetical protein